MLSSIVLAVPRPSGPVVSEDMGRQVITFYNKPCIPVDPKLLHQRMGPAFDSERMAMDEESMKRSALKARPSDLTEEEEGNYVNDEDYTDEEDDDEGLVDETESQESVTYYSDSDRRWTPRYHRSSRLDGVAQEDFYNVRNKRKAPLNSGVNKRKIRKSLKTILKRLERKQRKRRNLMKDSSSFYFHPPWECEMKVIWKPLDPEYFPRYLRTGECQTKTCVLNLYECIPKLYPVKILRRDPNRCNPIPTYGVNTTYEERWFFERKHVTVCCECGRRVRPSRRRS